MIVRYFQSFSAIIVYFFTERNYTQTALTCLIGPQWNARQQTFTARIYSPPLAKRDTYYIISPSEDSHMLRNNSPAPFFPSTWANQGSTLHTVLHTTYIRLIRL